MPEKKRTPPTTVRLKPELHRFIRAEAERRGSAQSAIINDAIAYYMKRKKPARDRHAR